MELSNTRIVPAPPVAVWAALNDPAVLKACVPGCESLERTGEDAYELVMSARIGPVSARFTGRMTMTDIDAPRAYTLNFEGQGGAAGFARGDARVTLAPEGERQTALTYVAKAQIGGKLAQVGSRLVNGVAAKMSDDFFARFVARFAPPDEPAPVGASATVAAQETMAETAAPPSLAPPGGSQWIRYAAIVAIIVVLVVLYARGYRP
ncbi:MAG TPA: carbon monoxide dehydrogenase subunit G [Casimicrobiaceae bacterium]|nr:carbon monoxide dehydrogenase subunit G [Casimicrobiaceae bacterium]